MTRRKDGRWVKKITLPDGSIKYFYSSANSEREATKDINQQFLNFEKNKEAGKAFKQVAEKWVGEYRERISDITYNKNTRAAYERIVEYFSNNKDINLITTY